MSLSLDSPYLNCIAHKGPSPASHPLPLTRGGFWESRVGSAFVLVGAGEVGMRGCRVPQALGPPWGGGERSSTGTEPRLPQKPTRERPLGAGQGAYRPLFIKRDRQRVALGKGSLMPVRVYGRDLAGLVELRDLFGSKIP